MDNNQFIPELLLPHPGFFLFVFSSSPSRISKPSHWLRARTRVHSGLPLLQTDKSWKHWFPFQIPPENHKLLRNAAGPRHRVWKWCSSPFGSILFFYFSHGRISRENHGLLFPPWISAYIFLCTVLWIGESPVSFPFWLRLLHAAPGPKNAPSQEAMPGKLGDLYLSNTWVILQCMFLKYLERFAKRILLLCYQKSYKMPSWIRQIGLQTFNGTAHLKIFMLTKKGQ